MGRVGDAHRAVLQGSRLPRAGVAQGAGHHLQHESRLRGLGQLGNGKLLQFNEYRKDCQKGLPIQRAGPRRYL